MAIGAITMILTNVGLQMFNSWRGSKQSAELQQKREEFEQAARERNVAHMMKLMREGQELTLQIEKENHEQRLNDIKGELDNLLQRLTYEMAITNWPLRVLPVVMKNQAFGNLLANQEEKLALHVILTRSNYDKFNNAVLPSIEKSLEQYCNQHWSTMGDHPVLFYSGAWKSRTAPTGSEISSLKTSLSNLPTLLITPLFRPSDGNLVFQVNMWGVGATSTEEFAMTELEPTNFQRTFSNSDDYDKDVEVCSEIIKDIVPYLQCLIGYLADTYFWSSTGAVPLLPTLLTNGVVNTDGIGYLKSDYQQSYERLLQTSEDETSENPFTQNNSLALMNGCLPLLENSTSHYENIFVTYCNTHNREIHVATFEQAVEQYSFTMLDLKFLINFVDTCNIQCYQNPVNEIISVLQTESKAKDNTTLKSLNLDELIHNGKPLAFFRLGELYDCPLCVNYDPEIAKEYFRKSSSLGCTLSLIRDKVVDGNPDGITSEDIQYLQENPSEQSSAIFAWCLANGYGVERSPERAMEELEKHSESPHPVIYYTAARIVQLLYGSEQWQSIVELLYKASDLGYVKAQVDLMNMYESGDILPESPDLCVEFAQKAALQGEPEALLTLGLCFLRGYGVPKDKQKAKHLFVMSAERGNSDALEILNIHKQ